MKLLSLLGLLAVVFFSHSPAFADDYSEDSNRQVTAVDYSKDPVAHFPDEELKLVDENGNWIEPVQHPIAQDSIPETASFRYSGAGN